MPRIPVFTFYMEPCSLRMPDQNVIPETYTCGLQHLQILGDYLHRTAFTRKWFCEKHEPAQFDNLPNVIKRINHIVSTNNHMSGAFLSANQKPVQLITKSRKKTKKGPVYKFDRGGASILIF